MADPQTGMAKADMKRLLASSKKEPVSCAIGLGPDAGTGLMMLDKIKQPRALEKMLTDSIPGAKNTRWGTASVDIDDDPKLVKLTLNRAVSGMARRLAKTLKGTGISRVLIVLEDGTEVERHQEPEEEQEAGAQPDATPPPDPAALAARLAGLVKAVQRAGGTVQQELAKMAMAANAALKAGDLPAVATGLDQLEERLGNLPSDAQLGDAQPGTQPGAQGGDGSVVRLAKGLLIWNSTRGYVDQQVKKLQHAITEQTAGEPDFEDIRANLGNVASVLELLDDRLSDKLDALRGATDPAAKASLSAEARQVVTDYKARIAQDPLMADIDDNGFVPLDINVKVNAALDAVLKTI